MIEKNVKNIQSRIISAALKCGRDPNSIKLVAVSKTKSASDIIAAYDAGVRIFGENYVQEAIPKINEVLINRKDAEFHFIGHLQSNKVKLISPLISCIQTVDSFNLANKLNEFLKIHKLNNPNFSKLDILVQIKVSQEETKSGVLPCEVLELIGKISFLDCLNVVGLMTIGSFSEDIEDRRKEFAEVRKIRDKVNSQGFSCHELSMGMSDDFEIAIEEGATLIRVGSSIFGAR